MKSRTLTIVFAAICLLAPVTAQGQTLPPDIDKSKVLRVALNTGYPPLEMRDPKTNEIIGFDVDLAAAIAKVLGVKIEYQDGAFESDDAVAAIGPCRHDHERLLRHRRSAGRCSRSSTTSRPAPNSTRSSQFERASDADRSLRQDHHDARAAQATPTRSRPGARRTASPPARAPIDRHGRHRSRPAADQSQDRAGSRGRPGPRGRPDDRPDRARASYRPLGEPFSSTLMGMAFQAASDDSCGMPSPPRSRR